jgi:hypothetical protein
VQHRHDDLSVKLHTVLRQSVRMRSLPIHRVQVSGPWRLACRRRSRLNPSPPALTPTCPPTPATRALFYIAASMALAPRNTHRRLSRGAGECRSGCGLECRKFASRRRRARVGSAERAPRASCHIAFFRAHLASVPRAARSVPRSARFLKDCSPPLLRAPRPTGLISHGAVYVGRKWRRRRLQRHALIDSARVRHCWRRAASGPPALRALCCSPRVH